MNSKIVKTGNIVNTGKTARLEAMLAQLLDYGTWFSSAVTAVGLALLAAEANLPGCVAPGLCGTTVVSAGIALLIMLPVLRLVLMLAVFLQERDYVFGAITAAVLGIIAIGTALGMYLPVAGA